MLAAEAQATTITVSVARVRVGVNGEDPVLVKIVYAKKCWGSIFKLPIAHRLDVSRPHVTAKSWAVVYYSQLREHEDFSESRWGEL